MIFKALTDLSFSVIADHGLGRRRIASWPVGAALKAKIGGRRLERFQGSKAPSYAPDMNAPG